MSLLLSHGYFARYFEKWILDCDKSLHTDGEGQVDTASQSDLSQRQQEGNQVSVARLLSDSAKTRRVILIPDRERRFNSFFWGRKDN